MERGAPTTRNAKIVSVDLATGPAGFSGAGVADAVVDLIHTGIPAVCGNCVLDAVPVTDAPRAVNRASAGRLFLPATPESAARSVAKAGKT